ncbi:CorA family divalent cation transporter [Streptomyces venezuelae]
MTTPNDTAGVHEHWVQVPLDDLSHAASTSKRLDVDFERCGDSGRTAESDQFVYLPVTFDVHPEGGPRRQERVVFALGADVLVTLQPTASYAPFAAATTRMRRLPHLAESPQGVMYALLYALNQTQEKAVEQAGEALARMSEEVCLPTDEIPGRRQEIGLFDLKESIQRMNALEEAVSNGRQSQLMLARAARHLRTETELVDPRLASMIDALIADIEGIKERAGFEFDRARYLQQSVMTSLDVKQKEIAKLFTIITAVFLPPALIASFYGMNFTNMPELTWKYGFLFTTALTLVSAVIPLWYIRRRGWLR